MSAYPLGWPHNGETGKCLCEATREGWGIWGVCKYVHTAPDTLPSCRSVGSEVVQTENHTYGMAVTYCQPCQFHPNST